MTPDRRYRKLRSQATAHLDAGRYGRALELFIEAEPLADQAELCGLLGDMAVAYLNLGNKARAIQVYGRAIETCRAQRDAVNLSRWCQNLALIRIDDDALDDALELLTEALAAARDSGNAYQISTALGNTAIAFQRRGELDHAVNALEQAERTASNSPNLRAHWRQLLVAVNRDWAMELVGQRAWAQARNRAIAGLKYASVADDEGKTERASLHAILAGVAYELGDLGTVTTESRQAVELYHAAGRPDLAQGLLAHLPSTTQRRP
jgi:tetratricopeptide (TPR) repeat protein